MPLGCYVPALFPTYFTLCLSAAHITLNCALFFLQQHEEEPLCYFGCMNVSMRCYAFATGLFIFARVRHHLLYLRGSPCFHATLGPSLCPYERFLHLPPKTNPPTFCDNFTGFFSVWQNVLGWEPAQFARQVIPLCSLT